MARNGGGGGIEPSTSTELTDTVDEPPHADTLKERAAPASARSPNVGGAFRWGSAIAGKAETMKLDPLWLVISLLWTIALGVPLGFLIFAQPG
jgi:hypothetical protein